MSTTEIVCRDGAPETAAVSGGHRARWAPRSVEVFTGVLVVAVLARGWLTHEAGSARVQAWVTVFVSIVLQASSFVVLGTVVSAGIAVLVPAGFFARVLPRRAALAVPVAGLAGAVLPGCECGSVPVAGALMRRGVTPAAALAFLLSAPAINPVVLVATSVAFPGRPVMVLARLAASALASTVMGWVWLRVGRTEWLRVPHRPELDGLGKGAAFVAACRLQTEAFVPAVKLAIASGEYVCSIGERTVAPAALADLAEAAAVVLTSDSHENEILELSGFGLTALGIASIIATVADRQIPLREVAAADLVAELVAAGASRDDAADLADLYRAAARGEFSPQGEDLDRLLGHHHMSNVEALRLALNPPTPRDA